MRRYLAVLLLFMPHHLSAAAPPTREHKDVYDGTKRAMWTITEVNLPSSPRDEHWVLVRDVMLEEDWLFYRALDYEKHLVVYSVSDLRGEIFVRLKSPLDFSGDTREAFLAENQHNSALQAAVNAALTIETSASTHTGVETQWNDSSQLREWRSNLRRTMNPNLLDAIERLRPVLQKAPLSPFYDVFIARLLYEPATADARITIVPASPDCSFDAAFGFDCTDEQVELIDDARTRGKILRFY